MKNITLAVDDTVLEKVRVHAVREKTSVDGLVRNLLQSIGSAQRLNGSV